MQRNFFIALVLLLMTMNGMAQGKGEKSNGFTTRGKVIDSLTRKPIEYATISIFSAGKTKPDDGTVTDREGVFSLQVRTEGTYKLLIESIGFKPVTLSSVSVNSKTTDLVLPDIVMASSRITLETVTVNAGASLIEQKIDKLVFNAEKDLSSLGGVATDVLKKVPQVSVDVDGNVELAGSTGIRFLINGKPSTAFGSNIADVLQSIPASQIKSIEVITNPGARYDAQGLGGIINIILKKSKAKGMNGNISLAAGTRNENGSLNFNVRNGNFGISAFISGNASIPATQPSQSDRLSQDTAAMRSIHLQQYGNVRSKRFGIQSGIGFDWTFNKLNNLTGSIGYDRFGNSGNGLTDQLQEIREQNGGSLISSSAARNQTDNRFVADNYDFSLAYKRNFKNEDQELELSVNSSFENSRNRAGNKQSMMPADTVSYGNNSTNPGKEAETEIELNYTQPLKEDVILGIGGKMVFTHISGSTDAESYAPASKKYAFDPALSNSLDYRQQVYAFYSELSFPVGKLFDARIGGRYERTQISSFFSDAQQQAPRRGYNTFVPSIFLMKRIGENQNLKLSYARRIERPDFNDLNPFINTTDPKNITAGNPYLLPETGHRFELSFNRSFSNQGSMMITFFYRINNEDIQPFVIFYPSYKAGDSIYTNSAVSMRQNIGTEKNMGLTFFSDLPMGSKLSIRTNITFFRRHTINAINAGYNSTSFNYRANLNAGYQFSKDLSAEFFGSFRSARNEAQGKYPSFTTYSFAIRKQFFNKKMSLALNATNPFNRYVNQRTELYGPNFEVNSLRRVPFRSIGINLTLKFGKLEFNKKEKQDEKDNGSIPADDK